MADECVVAADRGRARDALAGAGALSAGSEAAIDDGDEIVDFHARSANGVAEAAEQERLRRVGAGRDGEIELERLLGGAIERERDGAIENEIWIEGWDGGEVGLRGSG